MRVDLYLKLMGITKTRMLAKRLCDQGKILLENKVLKPSQEVLAGETIHIFLSQKEIKLKIIEIPSLEIRGQIGTLPILLHGKHSRIILMLERKVLEELF